MSITDEKQGEPTPNYNMQILVFCLGVGFAANYTITKNISYSFGATIGLFVIPGIAAFIASNFTQNWGKIFACVWVIFLLIGLAGYYLV